MPDQDRVEGKVKEGVGYAKEKAGEATGDQELEGKGAEQRAEGKGQSAVGKVKDKVGDAVDSVKDAVKK